MSWYRLLLRLYPAAFRDEYGDEMAAAFNARTANASGLTRALAAFADVVPSAFAVHAEMLGADLRHARRTLARSPGFATTAILVIALGVGANTAAFSVADFVLLRPLPFPHPEQLVRLFERTPGYQMELSPGNYKDWKADARSFSSMGAYFTFAVNVTGSGDPRRIQAARVTWDLFQTLGAKPEIGRGFTPSDTVAAETIAISHELWQSQFGGSAGIVGTRVQLDDTPYIIAAVMPPEFHYPARDVQIYTLFHFTADELVARDDNFINVVARLAPGATIDQARAELATITARLERQFPDENAKTGASVDALSDQLSARDRLLLIALCGATLCILLLACANLASLLLARAVTRERELAVRAALGASQRRLIRQVVTENALLSAIGGVAGVAVAIGSVPLLARLVPSSLPIAAQPSVDVRVLLFAGAVIVATGLLFSIAPAMRAASAAGFAAARSDARSGGGRQRTRSALVVLEVLLSVVLLTCSGLLMRAMWRLQGVDPGFRAENVMTLRTALPWPRYAEPRTRQVFFDKVLKDVRALPGVTSAAYISYLPMAMRGGIWPVVINGNERVRAASNSASLRFVTPQFFQTLRIPLLQGRDVEATDAADRPSAVVVSASFAKRYWPSSPALGQRFTIAAKERTVVGVVGDVRVRGLERTSEPQVYISYQQVDSGSLIGYTPKDLVIRSATPMATLVPEVRRIVHDADPLQPVSDVQTLEAIVAGETASRLAQLRVLAILATLALVLSAVGLHGLLSFTVSARSREIGVRMALGARSDEVRMMILKQGFALALFGIVPGAAVAYVAGRSMEALLAGVSPNDAPTFVVAMTLCAAATIAGCLTPAARAARVDPMTAMRAD